MLDRRSFLKSVSAAAAAAAAPAWAAGRQEGPELLFVSGHGPDHPAVRSAVAQLLEQGIWFRADEAHGLPSRLPASLEGYRAVLLDEPAARAALAGEEARRVLRGFAAGGGFVFRLEDLPRLGGEVGGPAAAPDTSAPREAHVVDLFTAHRCHELVTHAGLTRAHPGQRRQWLGRDEGRMEAELKAYWVPRLARGRGFDEFALHDWKAGCAWIAAGHEDVVPELVRGLRRSAARIDEPVDHDRVAGFAALIWLSEQTGERSWLEKARELVDGVLRRRPRIDGLMAGGGYADDPLGLGRETDEAPRLHRHGSTNRRDVVWTEFLHFHGPVLAALSRATGDPPYLEEGMRIVEHVRRFHVRRDGLLAHCTRRGAPVAGAWGRGQTHALYGLLYMLEELRPGQPEFRIILDLIESVGMALGRFQDPGSGLWRNLVDHPSSRLESSATTGITYVLARCIREGWLDRERFEPMVLRAWEGVRSVYWRGGLAASCRGTGTGDEAYYLGRPQGWARLPHLVMALLEMRRRRH